MGSLLSNDALHVHNSHLCSSGACCLSFPLQAPSRGLLLHLQQDPVMRAHDVQTTSSPPWKGRPGL
jgi:hypothetical protein